MFGMFSRKKEFKSDFELEDEEGGMLYNFLKCLIVNAIVLLMQRTAPWWSP